MQKNTDNKQKIQQIFGEYFMRGENESVWRKNKRREINGGGKVCGRGNRRLIKAGGYFIINTAVQKAEKTDSCAAAFWLEKSEAKMQTPQKRGKTYETKGEKELRDMRFLCI